MKLENILQKYFGFTDFRPGQKEVIASLLAGQSTLAMLPTGSGKSLCYQLPAYILNKNIIIVSPLLSLMQDQAEQLKMRGEKKVISLNSFLSHKQKQAALNQLGRYRFIFLSPEMLRMSSVMATLKRLDIGLFVVDEAHCISQWGYDFRPDYLNLGGIRAELNNPLTLALTASATVEVRTDIAEKLRLSSPTQIITSIDRKNIALTVEKLASYDDKLERLIELTSEIKGSGIIYFSSKKLAESAAALLTEKGIKDVSFYHGGMEQEQRMLMQQQFLCGQIRIICATSAFGMGINKEDVRFVIHFHLPMGMEAYVQEIGRAGRDGKQSVAILLYSAGDEGLPIRLAEQELPTSIQIEESCRFLSSEGLNASQLPQSVQLDLMAKYSLNETQLRFILAFIKDSNPAQKAGELIGYVQERKLVKHEKFSGFFQWLQSSECRRKLLLNYFQEEKKAIIPYCCDNCGFSNARLFEELPAGNQQNSTVEQNFSWKKELESILLLKRAVINEK
ncbi:ATP-dependent DNA helicase [Bacillus sp. M6-12]|uniref:RecQ family ATP-dependent DNA helicase n=1 Tax=Bacillus sp. M6-12 TaxID=2054166 RepID=UPI000C772138|nr:ATP-dependent DNA helicase RecQ [Bacillus sp. M6-12]PLS16383.1 ATP-dependent DNA helicase [Bacillus sp. M6-12]